MPSPPSLSAHITNVTYFTVMTTMSDQNMGESKPRMFAVAHTHVMARRERLPHREERVRPDVAIHMTPRAPTARPAPSGWCSVDAASRFLRAARPVLIRR